MIVYKTKITEQFEFKNEEARRSFIKHILDETEKRNYTVLVNNTGLSHEVIGLDIVKWKISFDLSEDPFSPEEFAKQLSPYLKSGSFVVHDQYDPFDTIQKYVFVDGTFHIYRGKVSIEYSTDDHSQCHHR